MGSARNPRLSWDERELICSSQVVPTRRRRTGHLTRLGLTVTSDHTSGGAGRPVHSRVGECVLWCQVPLVIVIIICWKQVVKRIVLLHHVISIGSPYVVSLDPQDITTSSVRFEVTIVVVRFVVVAEVVVWCGAMQCSRPAFQSFSALPCLRFTCGFSLVRAFRPYTTSAVSTNTSAHKRSHHCFVPRHARTAKGRDIGLRYRPFLACVV